MGCRIEEPMRQLCFLKHLTEREKYDIIRESQNGTEKLYP